MTLKAVDSWSVTVKHLKPKKIRVTARRIRMIVKNNSKGGFTVNVVFIKRERGEETPCVNHEYHLPVSKGFPPPNYPFPLQSHLFISSSSQSLDSSILSFYLLVPATLFWLPWQVYLELDKYFLIVILWTSGVLLLCYWQKI